MSSNITLNTTHTTTTQTDVATTVYLPIDGSRVLDTQYPSCRLCQAPQYTTRKTACQLFCIEPTCRLPSARFPLGHPAVHREGQVVYHADSLLSTSFFAALYALIFSVDFSPPLPCERDIQSLTNRFRRFQTRCLARPGGRLPLPCERDFRSLANRFWRFQLVVLPAPEGPSAERRSAVRTWT